MKRTTLLFLTAAAALAPMAPADARPARSARQQAEPAIPAGFLALLQSNPAGGDALTAAIADALTNDATIAPAVVSLAARANSEQKASIAAGALQALQTLLAANPGAAQAILAALQNADSEFRAILAALQARTYAQNAQGSGRGNLLFFPGTGGFSSGGGAGAGGVVAAPVSPN